MYWVLDTFLVIYERFFNFNFMREWFYAVFALAFLATVPRLMKSIFFWR